MPYSYTNRHGKTHYFRAVQTKSGKYRYYVTISDEYPNLIEDIPIGFEITELPVDAKVVIRKVKPVNTTWQEKEIVHDAIKQFSAIKDFFIHSEEAYLYVYHSQFSSAGGQEESLSREEAISHYGRGIEGWMRFFTCLRFKIVDREKRLFQTERVVFLGFYGNDFHPTGVIGPIEDLAREYSQHLGRDSFFDLKPNDLPEE
ncbi:MAG: hypothetical protein KTR30_38260 [Saprospiraceae bacterium]|nr:hypothetical protein [Saprospiraceae bacterium]